MFALLSKKLHRTNCEAFFISIFNLPTFQNKNYNMRSHIKSSTRLGLNLLVLITFLIFGSYYCTSQEKALSIKDLVQSTDSLNNPIYLYKGNSFTGVVSHYYENGNIKIKANLIDGILNGLRVAYFENGNIERKDNIINNVIEGEYEAYYENGNLKRKGYIVDGKKQGQVVSYHNNGNLEVEGVFKDDKKEGNWK